MQKISKRPRKLLKWFLGLFLAGLATFVGINLLVVCVGKTQMVSCEKLAELSEGGDSFDCIMVLGCGVYDDGTPTPMLKDRLDKAIELYREGFAPKLLLSGDHGTRGYNEVAAMYDYCVSAEIPVDDIFLDHAGFSTYESVYRAQAIFGIENILIVTQPYHLYRAMYYAKSLGLSGYGIAAEKIPYSGELYRQGRESLSRIKAFAYGILKPLPTYMGDKIDIKGSGTVTFDFE